MIFNDQFHHSSQGASFRYEYPYIMKRKYFLHFEMLKRQKYTFATLPQSGSV